MNLEDLRVFVAVARTQSMTRAGNDLGLAKSVVSRRMNSLEHHLGVRLFTRSTRSMGLTADGLELLRRAPPLLEEADALRDALAGSQRRLSGPVRITAPTSLGEAWLGPVLFAFARRHPDVDLRVELSDRSVDLVAEGLDLAVRVGHAASSDLVARRLGSSTRVIVAAPSLLKRHGTPTTADAAQRLLPAVAYTNRSVHREWLLRTPEGTRSIEPRIAFRADSGCLAVQAAIDGLGMAVTPAFLAGPAVASGALQVLRLDDAQPEPDDVFVLRAGGRLPPLRVRALIDHIVAAFAAQPSWEEARAVRGHALSANARQSVREDMLLLEGLGTQLGSGAAVEAPLPIHPPVPRPDLPKEHP